MPDAITAPVETQPSLEDRVSALRGEAADIWKFKGDLAAAEAKNSELAPQPEVKEPDVTSDPSPDTPSEGEPQGEPESEAASEPVEVEQPVKGETPEQKSERKRRNDERRWDRVTRERAEYKARLELLEKQLAEKSAAPATAAETKPKPQLTERPKRPKMSQFETAEAYDTAMDQWEDQIDQWNTQVNESREIQSRSRTEAEKLEAAYQEREKAARTKYADLESKPFFAKDFKGSDALNYVIRTHPEGFDYAYALDAKNAKRIAEMTHIPDLDALSKSNPARAAALMSEAITTAKYELKALLKPAAASPRQPTGQKPTSEVRLDRPGIPVADVRAKAIADGDVATFKRLENERLRKG